MPRPSDHSRRRSREEKYLSEGDYEIEGEEEYLTEADYVVERPSPQPARRRAPQPPRRPPKPKQAQRRAVKSSEPPPSHLTKPPVAAVVWGFGAWIFALITNTYAGFFDWAIQQFVLFMFAVGVFSSLNNLPVVGLIQRDINKLIDHYDRNPKQIQGVGLFLRLVPPFSYYFIIRDFAILAPILIVGIPLDIGLEAFTQYVLQFPGWGKAARLSFPAVICWEFFLTVTTAPFLVLSAMSIRLFER